MLQAFSCVTSPGLIMNKQVLQRLVLFVKTVTPHPEIRQMWPKRGKLYLC